MGKRDSSASHTVAFTLLQPRCHDIHVHNSGTPALAESGTSAKLVKRFAEPINGLHHMPGGALVVATDADTWSADLPCRIYLSDDGGQTFREILEIPGGTALWWSLASDRRVICSSASTVHCPPGWPTGYGVVGISGTPGKSYSKPLSAMACTSIA